jgi:transcriptional regulator with XRE-family HTH domain
MNINHNIKQFRELKNLSQEHMAKELRISQSSYARIENGTIDVKMERLQEIAKVLEVELPKLLELPSNLVFEIKDNHNCVNGYVQTNMQQNDLKIAYEKTIESLKEEILFLRGLVKNKE